MSKRIVIDLAHLDVAIKELEDYKKSIKTKLKILEERLAIYGANIARVSFSNAMYAGDNDVEVSVEKIKYGKGYKIVAKGQAVVFIEFGTGIINPEHPQSAEFGFAHGTYGKGKGKNPKGWVYVGSQGNAGQRVRDGVYRTMGNPPSRSMYEASKSMAKEIENLAREVFND